MLQNVIHRLDVAQASLRPQNFQAQEIN